MKKPLAILVLLFSYSSLYSQSLGLGIGFGKNGGSFQITGIQGSKVFHLAGNIFNGRNEEDTFEFSPSLFDDRDKGKLREASWVGYGFYQKVGNAAFSLAGGLSIGNEFFITGNCDFIYSLYRIELIEEGWRIPRTTYLKTNLSITNLACSVGLGTLF